MSEQGFLYVTEAEYELCKKKANMSNHFSGAFADIISFRGSLIVTLTGSVPRYKGGGNEEMESIEEELHAYLDTDLYRRPSIPQESVRT